jgi:hypothetical protein
MSRRTLNLTLAAAVAGCVLILPQAASAKLLTFRVTSATQRSNGAKTELPYQDSSSARWHVAKPTKQATNRFQVSIGNGIVWGLGSVNVGAPSQPRAPATPPPAA